MFYNHDETPSWMANVITQEAEQNANETRKTSTLSFHVFQKKIYFFESHEKDTPVVALRL